MAAVDEHLVRRADGVVLLLTPPFDDTSLEPGYIKGYVPGVRENGGQYTHAAIWSAIAFAALGDGDKAAELFAMLNPINHASTAAGVDRYKVEPYVVAADVYAEAPHVGRGGWTWYTGSAAWMYRAGLESILGFRLRGARLVIDPCIPRAWRGFEMVFRYRSARYDLVVENPRGVSRGVSSVESKASPSPAISGIRLVDDRNGASRPNRPRLNLGDGQGSGSGDLRTSGLRASSCSTGRMSPDRATSSIVGAPILGGSSCLADHPQHLRSRLVPLRRRLLGPPSGRHGDDGARFISVFDARALAR